MTHRLRLSLPVALACFAHTAAAAPIGDASEGERLFALCKVCHEVGEGARNRVGPHLNGLFGRTAGTVDGVRYSKAMQRAGSKGLEWHAEQLDAFLENPRQLVPGTRMTFRGLSDPEDRAHLIAYLRQYSASPANIVEADPTAAPTDHDIDPAILSIQGDPAYGEYLSSECTTCHRADGGDQGIPSIVLWPEDDFVVAMHAYKSKRREHPVMNMLAGRLNDQEIAALAAYFATLGNEGSIQGDRQ